MFNIWIRCLGGTVGSRVQIDSVIFSPDLVTIGSDTVIDEHSTVDPSTVENGELIFQRIKIGSRCKIMPTAYVTPGTNLYDDQIVGVMSTTTKHSKSANLKPSLSSHGLLGSRIGLRVCVGIPLLLLMNALPIFVLSIASTNLQFVLQHLLYSSTYPDLPDYVLLIALPHLTWITFTESFFSEVVVLKKLVIGKFKRGFRSRSAWNDFRYWMMGRIKRDPLFQQAMSPWNACELLSIKYRLW